VTPTDEILAALDDLIRFGKVLYGGLSNFPAWRIAGATTRAQLGDLAPVTGIETEYSLAERSADRELLPMAHAYGLGVLLYSPLAGGLLTGKYRRGETGRLSARGGLGTDLRAAFGRIISLGATFFKADGGLAILGDATMTSLDVPSHAELANSARELHPLLRRYTTDGEINRQLSDEVITALTDAGLFRLFTPRRFGGYATSLRTLVEVTETLAEADSSAAWVVNIAAGGAWGAAHATARAQAEVFGDNPDARVSGSNRPIHARRVDGGVQVSGRWAYASGAPHANWAGLGIAVPDDNGGPIDAYFALVPRPEVILEDTWHTAGMRGTGSHTWLSEDLFVPEHRLIPMAALSEGAPQHDEALYRLPMGPVFRLNLMGTLLGLGRAALDYTIQNAASKGVSFTVYARQSDSVAAQTQIAEAALKIDTARLHTYASVDQLDFATTHSISVDYPARARIWASSGYAVQQILDAIQLLLNVHGTASFAVSNPLQRIWRDANTAGRHGGLNTAVGYEVLGKTLLGSPERISPMV
jgi:alkylation response protein AidB-like acyl-CoA dehydrogenase